MSFETIRGLKGKVYVPDPLEKGFQKHPCKDCYVCQLCNDDRCRVCRDGQKACQCDTLAKR